MRIDSTCSANVYIGNFVNRNNRAKKGQKQIEKKKKKKIAHEKR